MKKQILFLASLFVITMTACTNDSTKKTEKNTASVTTSQEKKNAEYAVLSFAENEYNFGTISEGDIVNHKFSFTNTGTVPLIILTAKGSCGCTVSKWSKKPIAPGEKGEMLVTFNSNDKPNQQIKQVTITANTKTGKEILKIKAMVTPKTRTVTSATPVSK
ncbi:DUF1573 domain-containing protein [Aquimarina sp. I32.4]|uniref:DUF1573 domain-containing protein n=1 Tax=Aquimarina sp. I32.4 TaxID=2053903 RepID=UPI000CDE8BDA|nr:DUF1573 domain-containing protein [Aquimarina sp. I32.4]